MTPLLHLFSLQYDTPDRRLWVCLTLLSIALKLALAWRCFREYPMMAAYMVCASTAALRTNSGIGLAGELLLASVAIAFSLEALYVGNFLQSGRGVRKWVRIETLCVGGIVLGAGVMADPHYAGYSTVLYRVRFLSTLFCATVVGGGLLHNVIHWVAATKRIVAHQLLATVWFLAVLDAGIRWLDRFLSLSIITTVQLCCLIFWHAYVLSRNAVIRVK